jgi:pimeloyl-ACP methyl ester carboxylesterase
MPYVDDRGVKLWYQVTGAADAPALVLSGGFGLLHNQWDFVRPFLARKFKVVDWNYRGAGRSDRAWPGGSYTQDRWVDDLECVLAQLGLADVVLWGTSTGSPLTIRYAARYPARVRAMITYPMFKADPGFRSAFDGFTKIGETFGYEALAALTSWIGVSSENLFTPAWAKLAKWEASKFRANFGIESLGATMAIVAGNDFSSELAKISVPTLLLMGQSGNLGYDAPGNRALADEFLRRVPQAKLAVVPRGGGTYCMIERPRETAAEVIRFIERLPRQRESRVRPSTRSPR